MCWGKNDYDQTSLNDTNAVVVSAGEALSCSLNSAGDTTCVGVNDVGQREAPNSNFRAIDVGRAHACGINTSGAPECWGSNASGQLDLPTEYGAELVAVTAGGHHSCVLDLNGQLTCSISSDSPNNQGQGSHPQQAYTLNLAGVRDLSGHQDGAAETALFNEPTDAIYDNDGNLYIADTGNHRIRKLSPPGSFYIRGTGYRWCQ